MGLMRQHKLQRFNQMRRNAQQHFALRERFAHEPKFVMLKVAQSAVDELGRPLRGVRREVVLFNEQHRETAPHSVTRDARAIDAAANNK